ncbi:unnamed protein product [Tenebrio molitor]|jgi:hypothetical protein|nr:unnamed protein product [Tenebrio molitor]
MEVDNRKYTIIRNEVEHLIKEAKKQTWKEFGYKMKETYLENQKLL